ncbi:MAG: hypothetical protein ABJN78_09795 [Hyphomicrobiales bacterium]
MHRFFSSVISFFIVMMVLSFSQVAVANEQVLRNFAASMESRGLSVSLEGLSENGEEGALAKLMMSKEGEAPWSLAFHDVTFKNLEEASGGGLKGDIFTADKIDFSRGSTISKIDRFNAVDFDFPNFDMLLDNLAKPVGVVSTTKNGFLELLTSGLYKFLANMTFASIKAEGLDIDLEAGELAVKYAFGPFSFDNMRDGILASYAVDSTEIETSGAPQPTFKAVTGRTELKGYNFNSLNHVLDADAYKDGKGDGVWLQVSGAGFVDGMRYSFGNSVTHMARMELGAFRIRQFDEPPLDAFKLLLDPITNTQGVENPLDRSKQMTKALLSFYSMFEYGGFEIKEFDFNAPGQQNIAIGTISMGTASFEKGIAELSVTDMNVVPSSEDAGHLALKTFSLTDIQFPTRASILGYLDTLDANSKRKLDYQSLAAFSATLGQLSIKELDFKRSDAGSFNIDGLSVTLKDYIKLIPTKVKIDLSNVDVLMSSLPENNQAAQVLISLGYEKLVLNGVIEANWDEASGDLTVLPSSINAGDLGQINLSGIIGGVSRALIENPDKAALHLPTLLLKEVGVSFDDASFINKFLDFVAGQAGVETDALRKQYGILAAAPLAIFQNLEFSKKAETAIQTFLAAPGTISLSAKPPQPVPVVSLGLMMQQAPTLIVDALGLDISAK